MGALGVGTVRWHVALADRGAAAGASRARSYGRACRRSSSSPRTTRRRISCWPRPPRAAAAPTLGAAFDALVGRGWRAGRDGFVSRALAGPAVPGPRTPPLTLDAPAYVALLRGPLGAPLDPDQLRLEGVWIDGRPRRRP